jgi:hypothetical protein
MIVYALLDKGIDPWLSRGVLLPLLAGCGARRGVRRCRGAYGPPARPAPVLPFAHPDDRQRGDDAGRGPAAFGAMFFSLTLYMQGVLGYSPLRRVSPTCPSERRCSSALRSARSCVPRIGVKPVMVGGLVLAAAGLSLFTGIDVGGSYVSDVLPGTLLLPFGARRRVRRRDDRGGRRRGRRGRRLASGLVNAAQQVGSAVGLAALVSLAITRTADLMAPARRRHRRWCPATR